MRVIINGRKYRLRTSVLIRLEALALLALGLACYKTGADGAAVFTWLCGAIMLLGKIDSQGGNNG